MSAPDRVVVNVDGGARGNPGPAAVGIVVSDERGNELDRANDFIGIATNNVAEYRALLLGLERAQGLGAREVEVINDSELIARQVTGEYRVKNEHLRELHVNALDAFAGFERWSIRPVQREQNAAADELVNEALDAGKRTVG